MMTSEASKHIPHCNLEACLKDLSASSAYHLCIAAFDSALVVREGWPWLACIVHLRAVAASRGAKRPCSGHAGRVGETFGRR